MTTLQTRTPVASAPGARGRGAELACAWAGVAGLVVALTGMVLARILPGPMHASDSADEVVRYYSENLTSIRAGFALTSVAVVVVATICALLTVHMLRMSLGSPILPVLQAMLGAVTVVLLTVPLIVLNVAAFRPERDPATTLALHDLGFVLFFTPVAPFVLQNLVIAAAVLSDARPEPVLPRWLGYLNLWVAILFLPALGAYFFKTGPLAWSGILVFYLAIVVYGTWMAVMSLVLRTATLKHYAVLR
ncbi:MAG: hypothetical protein ACT4QG_14875 [Sporichthyaceae bacterium]